MNIYLPHWLKLFSRGLFCALILLLLTLDSGAMGLRAEGREPAIRVVSWNIQWFPGRSPEATENAQQRHREQVAAYLPGLSPDILILQEIRDEEAAQLLVDTVPGLELHVATDFQRPWTNLSQQIVIASRYPAKAGFAELFTDIYSHPEAEPYRGYAFAALDMPDGSTLLVYGVHLKSNLGEAEHNVAIREESARQILLHVEEMVEEFGAAGPVAVVVGGDFNLLLEREDMAHEQTLDLFLEAGFHWSWDGVPKENRVTWASMGGYGDACFDHIVTRGLPDLTAAILYKPDYRLSDHRPVLLRIPLSVFEPDPVSPD
jgi:endonuclease/exonuclease/phosphatase family metal-dependent hydrolase